MCSAEIDQLLGSPLDDPHAVWHRLRAEDPVHFVPLFGPWVVTRYADIVTALRAPGLGVIGHEGLFSGVPIEARSELQTFIGIMDRSLVHSDPPAHTKLRRLASASFTPRVIETMRPLIEREVGELLDRLAPSGAMDVLHDFSYPLLPPLTARLVGVPREHLHNFRRHFDAYYRSFRQLGNPGGRMQAEAEAQWLLSYFSEMLGERRRVPEQDLMSAALAGADGAVSEGDLVSLCVQLLFSGRETTPNFIANALLTLLRHPRELERLRHCASLMPSAVEELLRYEGVSPMARRIARERIEIGGKSIAPGHRVWLVLAAGNRDPAQFPEPDRLDLSRRDNHHLGLGQGTHFCLGAAVARLVSQIALRDLLDRFPSLRLAGPIEWRDDVPNRCLRSLPVAW